MRYRLGELVTFNHHIGDFKWYRETAIMTKVPTHAGSYVFVKSEKFGEMKVSTDLIVHDEDVAIGIRADQDPPPETPYFVRKIPKKLNVDATRARSRMVTLTDRTVPSDQCQSRQHEE